MFLKCIQLKKRLSIIDKRHITSQEANYFKKMDEYFAKSLGTNLDKIQSFPKYVPRQILSEFLARNELFKKIQNIHGTIIECGVHLGAGTMTWAQLSAIYEPYNQIRSIVGFDTFTGFVKIHKKDKGDNPDFAVKGGLATNAHDDLMKSIQLYDMNRPIGHIPRVQLVKGNAIKTIPKFVKNTPHLVIAMLYLDFDVYEPTKVAIKNFLPYMSKGSILVFDELNHPSWPGETQAVFETIGFKNIKIERFPFTPHLSYSVL